MRRTLRWLGVLSLLIATPAAAAEGNYLLYVPQSVSMGGSVREAYGVQRFDAPEGLDGAPLARAAWKELPGALDGAGALTVEIEPGRAAITIDEERRRDPRIRDRAVGAIYHTFRLAGLDEIRVQGEVVDASDFTRPALVPVLPLSAALPPNQPASGYVVLGGEPVPAATFRKRLAAGHESVRKAVAGTLDGGATQPKLAILAAFGDLGLEKPLELLLPRLDDEDPRVRRATVEQLRGRDEQRVLDALEGVAREDSDTETRVGAARILVDAGRQKFEKFLLLDRLDDPDASRIVTAAEKLIDIGDPSLAPAFVDLVRHDNPEVRTCGVEGLQAFERYELIRKLVADGDVHEDAVQPLARTLADRASGENQAVGVRWMLRNGGRKLALEAAEIARTDKVAGTTEALAEALERSEPEVRKEAARALGALQDPAGLQALAKAIRNASEASHEELYTKQAVSIVSVQPLGRALSIAEESSDETIRRLAVKALSRFAQDDPKPRVLDALTKRLEEGSKGERRAAAWALARIPHEAALEKLIAQKGSSDPEVREQLARALTEQEHPKAAEILTQYLDDTDDGVKAQALRGVREHGLTDATRKIESLVGYGKTKVKREAVKSLAELAEPGDSELFDTWKGLVYSRDESIKLAAIEELSHYVENPSTASALGSALSSDSEEVTLKALEALSGLKSAEAVSYAGQVLTDPSNATEVRLAALDAIEKLGHDRAEKMLREFILNEENPKLKQRADEVLDTL